MHLRYLIENFYNGSGWSRNPLTLKVEYFVIKVRDGEPLTGNR